MSNEYVVANITIRRGFILTAKEAEELRVNGVIPDLINNNAPKAVRGWIIDGLDIIDKQGCNLCESL